MRNKMKKSLLAVCMMLLAVMMLQGCGAEKTQSREDVLATMKEFSTPDETAFIHLNKEWIEEDVGMDSFLTAGSEDGSEAVLLMQFPKSIMGEVDATQIWALVEASYSMTNKTEETAFEIPGMTDIEAVSGTMTVDGTTGSIYVICGETEYAYYCIGYAAEKITDEIKSTFEICCSTFREEAPTE